MYPRLVDSRTFRDYPEAARFMDRHRSRLKCCLVTNCNDGFIVDVYQENYVEAFLH